MSKVKSFKSSFSLKKLLFNKRFQLLLSVVLAFIFWLLIMINENPIIERSFANMTVNVNLENTMASENGMSIIGDISSQKFTVIARGPTYLVSSLKSEDFNLYASAASVDAPGEYKLEVVANPTASNSGLEILNVIPSSLKVSFDYIDTKEFTIKPIAAGVTAKKGLIAESPVVSGTESDTITIVGPRTVLNRIESVVAVADIEKTLSVSETFDANIKLLNKNEKEIPLDNLTLSQEKVQVTVPISKKNTVPVEVEFINLPKDFDEKSLSYTINHENVTVIGKPETVKKIEKVTLSAIDISKVSRSSNSFDISAQLPDGVRLLDNIEHFTVEFNLGYYREKTVSVSKFEFVNLGGGMKAEGSKIKNVKVCGPSRDIYNLESKKVFAVADLKDKKRGEHTVPVIISVKDKNGIWAVGSYDATITIK